ncbi:hypothetical protein COV18_07375 [Candidatus Woesearchaeota archaeon CG10_big_fil_rev_8_21_14_0_10_37_12]|nr:MAG: hypothetical protein COV18_07375 [Candidatus Woesearchaeota archaeon CG10_big_fil_rev_8_21_14_0_10_37_12]
MDLNETLQILNPWWKTGTVSEELAKAFKRDIFYEAEKLSTKRQCLLVTGLRRVGKSTILYQLIANLLPQKTVYFNFDRQIEEIEDILNAFGKITKTDWQKEKIFVFLDEISKLSGWGNKLKLLYDALPNIKFILSSSSSFQLEKEAISSLAGRYFMLRIEPLSFKEFIVIKGKQKYVENIILWEKELKSLAKEYILKPFPEITDWEEEQLIKEYIQTTIIDKVVREDIGEKYKNIKKPLILFLIQLFFSEPGTYIDYDVLSKQQHISKKTLFEHIRYLQATYLIRKINNFRPSLFASSRKLQRIYPYWWSLSVPYCTNEDKLFETIVGSCINAKFYWRDAGKEIDFLVVNNKKIIPIEAKNKKEIPSRELKHLQYFMQKYSLKQSYVICRESNQEPLKNIQIIQLWQWLLELPCKQENQLITLY